jgi:hypothetical protein
MLKGSETKHKEGKPIELQLEDGTELFYFPERRIRTDLGTSQRHPPHLRDSMLTACRKGEYGSSSWHDFTIHEPFRWRHWAPD